MFNSPNLCFTKSACPDLPARAGGFTHILLNLSKIYEPSLRAQQLAPACPAKAGQAGEVNSVG